MVSTKKTIIVLSTVLCLLAVVTVYIVFLNRSYNGGHPFPDYNQVYEWRDPDDGEAVIRAIVTTWTDDTRELSVLMLKGMDGTVWYIDIDRLSLDDPNSWLVFRGSTEIKAKVPLSKMQSLSVGTTNVEDWQSIDKLDSK